MTDFAEKLENVKLRIWNACARARRDPDGVEIIGVTKTHDENAVREAWENGIVIVGENKVQEAAWKKEKSVSGPFWHLIGHLQTNKVRQAIPLFDMIHSVDSIKLLDRLETVADELARTPHVLLEVNVSGEKSKNGLRPEDLPAFLEHAGKECYDVSIEGFMTMAPFNPDPEAARPYFRKLRELRDEMEQKFSMPLPHLSMGMSGDFEVAVEEGATFVRLGTILFGDRPKLQRIRPSEPEQSEIGASVPSDETVRILD